MAARERVDGEQETFSDGHIIRFFHTFTNFKGRLPRYFLRSFTFDCAVVPTSWSIDLIFDRLQADGSVPCEGHVRRTDIHEISCYTNLSIGASTPMEDIEIRPEHITQPALILNARESQAFHNFVPAQVVSELGNEQILLQVLFRVRGCHRNQELAKCKEEDVSFMAEKSALLSKM